jgi:cell division protein FtsI/penicillin-binding protein 2
LKDKERSRLRIRTIALFCAAFSIATLLCSRLFVVQVRDGAALASDAIDEQRAAFTVSGRRGDIVDRFDVPFATNVPACAIYAQPSDVDDVRAAAHALAPLLGMSAGDALRRLTEKTSFVYLAREVPQPIAQRIARLGLRGIGEDDEPTGLRVDPQGRIGSTVVGFTGVDDQGLDGIEYSYDRVLAGMPGTVDEDTDSAGLPRRTIRRIPSTSIGCCGRSIRRPTCSSSTSAGVRCSVRHRRRSCGSTAGSQACARWRARDRAAPIPTRIAARRRR